MDKLNIFTNKYTNIQLSAFRQKKIEKLFKKNVFKVINSNKIVMPKKILSNLQVFNSCFINNIKDLYTDKVNKKSCLVVHI